MGKNQWHTSCGKKYGCEKGWEDSKNVLETDEHSASQAEQRLNEVSDDVGGAFYRQRRQSTEQATSYSYIWKKRQPVKLNNQHYF